MKGLEYDVLSNFPITLQHLKDMVNEEGLVIRPGDILLVRTGIGKWHRESTPEMEQPKLTIGVDPASELLEWIWDSNFAAVGSDAIAFECIPAPDGSSTLDSTLLLNRKLRACSVEVPRRGVARLGNAHWRVVGLRGIVKSCRGKQAVEFLLDNLSLES
jgi:kynurenine formamidase